MNVSFRINDEDALAFTERFLSGSESHQRLRRNAQWTFPVIMLGLLLFIGITRIIHLSSMVVLAGAAALWFFLFPKRFDANIRKHAIKQMKESSYAKSYGDYSLGIGESGLKSSSPLGESLYAWDGVDRVEMSDDYLFVFLAGPMGYPIRISEIGEDAASEAFALISGYLN